MTLTGILVAFGGGIFGAAIGGLGAFEFVGFLVLVGVAIYSAAPAAGAAFLAIPFGAFGPQAGGFAAGVAAAAYAASRNKLAAGRDIISPLVGLSAPDVLLVGGAFGAAGYVVEYVISLVPPFAPGLNWTDFPALSVVVLGIAARLMFGKTGVFGKVPEGGRRFVPDEGIRWIPWHSTPGQLACLGGGVGLLASWLGASFHTPGVFLAFGLAASSLIFLQFGQKGPVTHHLALPAALAGALSGSVIWGAIVGVVCAMVGEACARTLHDNGDTHIDAPATTIAIMTCVINFCASVGLFAAVPFPC